MSLPRPVAGEFNPMFQGYVDRVTGTDALAALEMQIANVRGAFGGLTAERETYRYEPGKWSVREVLGHVLDCERIFGFRLLSLARGEMQPLPGFEENEYALVAGHDLVPAAELLDEFELVRRGHLAMMHRFDDRAWARFGSVNGHSTVARAVPFIMIGHVRHHLAVLVSKYGELQ